MTDITEAGRSRSRRNAGMARIDRFGAEDARRRTCAFPAGTADRLHAQKRRLPALQAEHRLRQQHRRWPRAGVPGQPRARAAHRGVHPLECDGDGAVQANKAVLRVRWTPGELRLLGDAVRGRLQPFLARAFGRTSRRHGLHAGTLLARRLCARLPRRPPDRGAAETLSPGGRARPGWDCLPIPIPG